jgi:hypothetical protein
MRLFSVRLLAFCSLVLAFGPGTAGAADIEVILDQARLIKLPDRVSTLVVGNPVVADAAVQAGGWMIITGKGYGLTNIIALDRAGAVLMEKTVEVQGPRDVVVVYRGIERATYSCTPECERGSRSATARLPSQVPPVRSPRATRLRRIGGGPLNVSASPRTWAWRRTCMVSGALTRNSPLSAIATIIRQHLLLLLNRLQSETAKIGCECDAPV